MKTTEWGVTLGVKRTPKAKFVTYPEKGLYGWKIDRHGILAFGETEKQCRDNFVLAYFGETGQQIGD